MTSRSLGRFAAMRLAPHSSNVRPLEAMKRKIILYPAASLILSAGFIATFAFTHAFATHVEPGILGVLLRYAYFVHALVAAVTLDAIDAWGVSVGASYLVSFVVTLPISFLVATIVDCVFRGLTRRLSGTARSARRPSPPR